ncbi:unnamed protein product [marine sediment metagenome]|uniref:Uncharacterized protein n=1 Tax=marine sediment metagenome TaxID=412755 RepID=X0UQC2_9ZZZZ
MPGELSPGSTPRRWIPDGGEQKLRDKIHRESKFADNHKNLPFNFSKPPRSGKSYLFKCLECGHTFSAFKNTIMCICSICKKAAKTERVDG